MQPLTDFERDVYSWQLDIPGLGIAGQEKLKGATALVSRCGGLGGVVCYNLAAAGIGRLIIAHAGDVKPSDLNRQILMTDDWIGRRRVESAARRLRELNPRLEVVAVDANISDENVGQLVSQADLVFDCAPLFSERFALNRQCMRQMKPMIEAGVFGLEGQVTTIIPGTTPCLACLYPEDPPAWKRKFPVLGAVSAITGGIAAMEGIKLITGLGPTLQGVLLYFDAGTMTFRRIAVAKRPGCLQCGG
ncbi:MAG: HesA/MoeB/ThiF family protein [Pirellulales bacterium]|nr:HesA/MoeB/ThiF family protein [Pirellulales bacterium]